MEMSITLVLFAGLLAVHVPSTAEAERLDPNARVTHGEASSVAERYMKELYEERADDAPIVLCLVDTDILDGNYRQKPRSGSDCTALTRYRFSVGPLRTTGSITKAVLRAYLRVSPLTPEDVEVTVKARYYNPDKNATTESVQGELEVYRVTLTSQSSDWMEMDVTQGLKDLANFDIQETTQLELTVSLSTECMNKDQGRMVYFVDPTSFLSPARRARYMDKQPLLLVYTDYEQDKQPIVSALLYGNDGNSRPVAKRSRPHEFIHPNSCERQHFFINLAQLELGSTEFILPKIVDIGICSGSCTSENGRRPQTVYEILLGLAQEDSSGDDVENLSECKPTAFRPLQALTHTNGVLQIHQFQEAIVTGCTCEVCSGI